VKIRFVRYRREQGWLPLWGPVLSVVDEFDQRGIAMYWLMFAMSVTWRRRKSPAPQSWGF